MKKVISCLLIIFNLFSISCSFEKMAYNSFDNDGIRIRTKAFNKDFEFFNGLEWQKFFIKGVNMGTAKPGYFPGELSITKKEYLRWFKQISDMNANTIRVYTIQNTDFYEALKEFNLSSKNKLNLIHGIWIDEEDVESYQDAFNKAIIDKAKSELKDLIDVLHGKGKIDDKKGYASGSFNSDVSEYVIGYVIGIEWDPQFVKGTNENNKEKVSYSGEYLYTENASAFESFLCELGETAIKYETEKYNYQVPISFSNWPTTDVLKHPNEPIFWEDLVEVNTENIKTKDGFKAGLFATYHIYPYYPEFMSYDNKYREYRDETGEINPYRGYLEDLIKTHSVPVVVGEFGVPSSRGISHVNSISGIKQGNNDEVTQGKVNVKMIKDIYKSGYAGAVLFSWQDEWFKKSWNTWDYDIADRRAYWSNIQTSEQCYGLLAFDLGEDRSFCILDGDLEEWKMRTPLIDSDKLKFYVNRDSRYIYMAINSLEKIDLISEKIIIPIDITPKSGGKSYKNYYFDSPADFIIEIDGKDNSRILVQDYYDLYSYSFREKQNFKKDSNNFIPIYQCLSSERFLPEDKITVNEKKFESGKLVYGNSNENSLADFMIKDNIIELRIPWQLLNFMDPSTRQIVDDFNVNEKKISPIQVDYIKVGLHINEEYNKMEEYYLHNWDIPVYHERLKASYYEVKKIFNKY